MAHRPKANDERRGDLLLAHVAGLLALALYLLTLAPGVLDGDSGEIQFAAWTAGFIHPTGYPLYLLLGYAWTHLLPLGDPAWRMNALSALFGAVAVALSYRLALAVLDLAVPYGRPRAAQRLTALLAALTFAVTPTFWSQTAVAEVYSLHAAFVAAILLGMLAWALQPAEERSARPLFWTALIFGLSLAHHRTTLLLLPALATFLLLTRRRSAGRRPAIGDLARALPLLSLPLLLYAYIPLRAPLAPYSQIALAPGHDLTLYQPTLSGFLDTVTGQAFGSELRSPAGALAQALPAARLLLAQFTWPGILLAVLGLLWLVRQRSWPLLALTGMAFASFALFNLFYGIGDIYVYYIPAYLIWSLWLALGVAFLGEAAWSRRPASWVDSRIVGAVLALVLPIWLMKANYAAVDQSKNTPDVRWRAVLSEPLPQDAILVSNDRDEMMPLWYEQYVAGNRRDLLGLFPLIQPGPEWSNVAQTVGSALGTRRPVYLFKEMPGLDLRFQLQPVGTLVRVLGPAVAGPPANASPATFAGTGGTAVRLLGYDPDPLPLVPGGSYTLSLYWQPLSKVAANYTSFVHLIDAGGTMIGQSDQRLGGAYYPTSLWVPGEQLMDTHRLRLSNDLGQPPYRIVAGLYIQASGIQHLGRPEEIGFLAGQN